MKLENKKTFILLFLIRILSKRCKLNLELTIVCFVIFFILIQLLQNLILVEDDKFEYFQNYCSINGIKS